MWSVNWVVRRLELFLKRNNISLEPREFIILIFILFSIPFLAGLFFKLNIFLCLFLSIVILVLLFSFTDWRSKRENITKEDQFEQFLLDLVGNLYSNPNILKGIEKTLETAEYPLRKEFELVLGETWKGLLLNDALKNMIDRNSSKIINTVLLGLVAANDKGVDLVEFLKSQIEYIREKKSIESYVRILSSGPKYTSYIIMVIPLISVLVISLINKGFIEVLFSDLGILVLVYAIVSYAIGFFLINKIVNLSKWR